jgi:uncharacterized membrane protein
MASGEGSDRHLAGTAERIVQHRVGLPECAGCTTPELLGGAHMPRFRFAPNGRRALYPLLLAFAVACFVGTLATDLAYWRTANIAWANFSDWLVTIGVAAGYATLVVALVEVLLLRRGRLYRLTPLFAIGMIVALIVATFNAFVHTRDAWTSVVPWGLALSAIVVVVALVASWPTRATYRETVPEPYETRGPREGVNPKVIG